MNTPDATPPHSAPKAADLIPVTVLTGFLGSGKTTLLNALLKHPDMGETAVLINEFGEVGLDHLLVEAIDDDIVLLNSGCLCCTVRGDLVTAMRDLYFKRVRGLVPEFGRLLIETTGLADPAPILHTLMTDPLISSRYRLDGIVTTIDAVNGASQLDRQPEPVKQAAVADRLVLTKTDLATPEALADLEARLRAVNPAAPLLRADHGRLEPAAVLNAGLFKPGEKHPDVARWLSEEAYDDGHGHHGHHHGHGHDHHEHGQEGGGHHHHDVNRHDARISAFTVSFNAPLRWEGFVDAMEMLIASKGEDILRLKGLLNVEGEDAPVVVHAVQHVFHPPTTLPAWPDDDRRSRLVFITRSVNRAPVADLLAAALGQQPN